MNMSLRLTEPRQYHKEGPRQQSECTAVRPLAQTFPNFPSEPT